MAARRTPQARILNFATLNGQQLVTEGGLRIRLGVNGPVLLEADEEAAVNEEELLLNLRVFVQQGQPIWYQSATFLRIWTRERAAYDPRLRGALTGDRLLMIFKLLNCIAGYEQRFAASTTRRLGYFRTNLFLAFAPPPPLGANIPGPAENPHFHRIRQLLTTILNLDRLHDSTRLGQRIVYYEIHEEFRRLIQVLIDQGNSEREATRLAGEEMVLNLPAGIGSSRWKTISTCAKNWHLFMSAFGGLVGAFFFPEDESTTAEGPTSLFTHSSFGTHLTQAERTVLLELIGVLFRGIRNQFLESPLAQLAMDIRDHQRRAEFPRHNWENLPRGIQHAIPLLAGQPIIN
ncbi:hypothetical protein HOY82DRAFT_544285 [Tuber indicum]|nr:hypothetical protein HOY82DRAFT_544285 [Tuber indicum]